MSANASTTQPISPEKKTRAKALPEKYSKFIQFSYYMMSQMSETETFTKDDFLNQVKMFATVEEQQPFIQGFFDNQKENKKSMRKDLLAKKKADQPKKVKAPRKAKKEPTTNTQPSNDVSQENLIEDLTDELTEEPMITDTTVEVAEEPRIDTMAIEVADEPMVDKINAAIEVAEVMTAKKPRATKATGEKKPRAAKKKKAPHTTPILTEEDDLSSDM
tara:strand:+ start:188 stop:841 length:654 start_codon:yes stop_codon:yes gene_type:complete